MKIVAYVHLYVPNHNAGAEVMLHEILLELIKINHTATVICMSPAVENYQGVKLIDVNNLEEVKKEIKNSNIIFTHLDFTKEAIAYSKKYKKPIAHIIHNDSQINYHKIKEDSADLIISNSKWINDTIKLKTKKIIVYPPIKQKQYQVANSGDAITLINLCENKGVDLFWKLTDKLKDKNFIGVEGGYSEQIIKKKPNTTIINHTPNIKEVYSKTKILLVPSAYESWGRVGMEAFSSGIPVIAHPTPGLLESLGSAGIFVDRNNINEYIEKIKMLDNPDIYKEYSKKALERVKEVEQIFQTQIKLLEQELFAVVEKNRITYEKNKIKLSITVMAHPSREKWVNEIISKIGGDINVVWDRGVSLWDTSRRSWLSYDKNATHHLVIQDDTIPSENLRETLEEALSYISKEIVSICTIAYKMNSKEQAEYHRLFTNNKRWYLNTNILGAPAIIVPVEYIEDMIKYCDILKDPDDDNRIKNYCDIHGARVYNSVPSLVEHRPVAENPSLIKGHDLRQRGSRQTLIFIGENKNGLDLDWDNIEYLEN